MTTLSLDQVEKICNAWSLTTALDFVKKFNATSAFVLVSQDEYEINYKLDHNGDITDLAYCSTCKRALVDTSYCDGCDEDRENEFNQGDWL